MSDYCCERGQSVKSKHNKFYSAISKQIHISIILGEDERKQERERSGYYASSSAEKDLMRVDLSPNRIEIPGCMTSQSQSTQASLTVPFNPGYANS
jgi:hypothetical protein